MRRIGILTAGGDTPALNATIQGAVTRTNQLKVEIIGLIKGFSGLFNPRARPSGAAVSLHQHGYAQMHSLSGGILRQ
jgi:6-phosphofructokinase